MDLLGSILGSMEKPPSASEKEKKMAQAYKREKEKAEKKAMEEREQYRKKVTSKVQKFLQDTEATRLKLSPTSKAKRSLAHDIAELNGLISQSFGVEEFDRHLVFFKKEHPPCEEELQALRDGEEYVPAKNKPARPSAPAPVKMVPAKVPNHHSGTPSYGETPHYQQKYKHLLGGLDCAEKTAVKMEPNRAFGYVPSANKKDLRSIEQTLNDMKSRKRPKMDISETEECPSAKRTNNSS